MPATSPASPPLDTPPWRLGPYLLERRLGRGGMGEVWRATHETQRVPVAIKVLTGDRTREERFRRTLRAELRAVATLSHPGITGILDHGEIVAAEGGELPAPFEVGNPYLVLELVEGGSLRPLCGRLSWEAILWVLSALLDAMAHAHARGVIHRDIKPENVLLGRHTGSIKLTDFGLAFPVDTIIDGKTPGRFAGTPAYMAPEQAEGRWRDYGPWTDLYGLGCLAYALATGSPPFGAGRLLDVLNAHVHSAVPPMVPRAAVPAGFDAWTAALLEKQPHQRIQRAADALRALQGLSAPDAGPIDAPPDLRTDLLGDDGSGLRSLGASSSRSDSGLRAAPLRPQAPARPTSSRVSWSDDWSDTWTDPGARMALGAQPQQGGPRGGGEEVATGRVRLGAPQRVPPSWRKNVPYHAQSVQAVQALRGVGLGLFGLRVLPLVGREGERDALWAALAEVSSSGSSRMIALHGPEGVGKSRLSGWLCERAEELGVASALRVVFNPGAGPGEGFAAMLGRLYRVAGMGREELLSRLEERLRAEGVRDPDERYALAELIRPATAEEIAAGARTIRFGSPVERHALVRRALERQTRDRPLVVLLEGAELSPEALAWCQHVLEAQDWEPAPILLLAAITDPRGGVVEATLGGLLRHPSASRVALGPLPPSAHSALVREVLGFEGELAHQIEARTAGNPQFVVQLVGHWIERRLLEPGQRGYQLVEGAPLQLPEGLYRVWQDRVERLLEGVSELDAASLELAAVLGQEVRPDERLETLALSGMSGVPQLVEALLTRGLAWAADGGLEMGWSFAHGAVRSVLEARAEAAGRLRRHHLTCARMLESRGGTDALERRARHLLAAGADADALGPLIEAARGRLATGDYSRAANLLARWEAAISRLDLAPADPRRGEGALLLATLARLEGRMDEAVARVEALASAAAAQGWTALTARISWEMARVAWNRGEAERALRQGQDAEALAGSLGDRALQAECARDLGAMFAHRGEHARASARLWEANLAFAQLGDPVGEAYSLLSLGQIAQREDRLDEAERCFERALERFRKAGSRRGVADCDNSLAELARLRGDLLAAEAGYRAARAGFQAIGSGLVVAPEANLGIVLVERGRYAEAREVLEGALALSRHQGRRVIQGNVHAYLLPTLAAVRDWVALEHHRASAEALLAETGIVEEDIARMAETAGQLARDAGRLDAARAALTLAARQWEKLGRPVDAHRVREAIGLSPGVTSVYRQPSLRRENP